MDMEGEMERSGQKQIGLQRELRAQIEKLEHQLMKAKSSLEEAEQSDSASSKALSQTKSQLEAVGAHVYWVYLWPHILLKGLFPLPLGQARLG